MMSARCCVRDHKRNQHLSILYVTIDSLRLDLMEITMTIQPLFDRVLIKRKEQSRTTASGLILPGADQDKLNQGIVVAVGTGISDDNGNTTDLEVNKGDLVVFGK